MRARTWSIIGLVGITACIGLLVFGKPAHAEATGEFSLQVSPSPLVATLKPGQSTTLELKVRNTGAETEKLQVKLRTFSFNSQNQQLEIDDTKKPEIADWITLSAPTFTINSGETVTERITIDAPKDAAFSYSFALVISRAQPKTENAGQTLKGSVAVFSLFNVDRPGAKRQLEVAKFTPKEQVYEYLPAKFEVSFKNTGNTIAQPAGNVFIQRGSDDKTPIDTVAVNKAGAHILPGTTRTLEVSWDNGFPANQTTTKPDGSTSTDLNWNWNNLSNFRFGQYTAKLVAIYNDGQRDIPIVSEVTFWVIPWKLLLGLLVVVVLIGFGIWSVLSKTIRAAKRIKR